MDTTLVYLPDADDVTAGATLTELGAVIDPATARAELLTIRLREGAFREWLEKLADELSGALPEMEVRLVYRDAAHYLEFGPAPAADANTEA